MFEFIYDFVKHQLCRVEPLWSTEATGRHSDQQGICRPKEVPKLLWRAKWEPQWSTEATGRQSDQQQGGEESVGKGVLELERTRRANCMELVVRAFQNCTLVWDLHQPPNNYRLLSWFTSQFPKVDSHSGRAFATNSTCEENVGTHLQANFSGRDARELPIVTRSPLLSTGGVLPKQCRCPEYSMPEP